MNLVGGASTRGGSLLRRTLGGRVQGYALIVTGGTVVVLALVLLAGFGVFGVLGGGGR